MLRSLHIANYVLIERLDLSLPGGFSVITGETGAGKSILLGALGLLTGRRADAKSIRSGAAKCVVEAVFDVSALGLGAFFADNDIDFDGTECIVRREVTAAGKSRAFINDTPVSLAVLRRLTDTLVDIHSQHQNLLMGDERFLLDVLDSFGNDATLPTRYREAHTAWHTAARELAALKDEAALSAREADYMRFQLAQLDEAALRDGEQEELEAEQEQLAHSEEIKDALYRVSAHLTDEQADLIGSLRADAHTLGGVAGVFPAAAALEERIESVRIEIEDIAAEAEQAYERLDFDPARLAFVEERLATLYDLQKKHRADTVADLIALADDLRAKLGRVDNADELIQAKEQEVEAAREAMQRLADTLTTARQQAAATLTDTMLKTVADLGMPGARLQVTFDRRQPDATGQDEVVLRFSANKSTAPQDVARVASGGEVARLMLALKAAVAARKALPTIIFDEIDTGVSGRMADAMAGVMARMADNCQVLCITHLPQIAAVGAAHYKVYKEDTGDATATHIARLDEAGRLREVATMLSGADVTDAALGNARELLAGARKK
ncbi:MAG: DNA repair protein RecN [Bacteroidaceae bacterium]|nr:DNA repair protein RecN [Bacteroidaceae bacterium]